MEILKKKSMGKIKKNKKTLEESLKVKIQIAGTKLNFKGREEDIYIAEQVVEAIDKCFSVKIALLLKRTDYIFVKIPIKKFSKKNLETINGRIIGREGKTLENLERLSNCFITLHDNIVSIIGPAHKIKDISTAIKKLIKGSKQTNVYAYLEKQNKKPKERDLGIKKKFKAKNK